MRILHTTVILGAALTAAGACSLIYPLDAEQCTEDKDCPSGSFCNTQQNICELPVVEMGGGGNGGTAASGGGGTGATGGNGATGGTGGSGGCTTHAQCVNEHDGEPHICRDGTCVGLRNNFSIDGGTEGECIVVVGEENLTASEDVFVFGAFSLIEGLSPTSSPFTLNYAFAVSEFTNEGGIIINGRRTLPVGVVCNAEPTKLSESFDHLVDTVGVQAIITPLPARDLRNEFERIYQGGDGKKVLMISPFESDSSLARLPDEGLVWTMLPDSGNTAPPYVPLLERVEAYLRTHFWLENETDPIRVALVVATDNTYLNDVGLLLEDEGMLIDETPTSPLRFNGMTPEENGSANFRLFVTNYVPSISPNPPDVTQLANELKAFAPHVVVSAAGPEFITLMQQLETRWQLPPVVNQNPPFYIVSPFQRRPELQTLTTPNGIPIRERVVGVNPAAAEDQDLYNDYYARFSTFAAGCGDDCVGTENFYDPVYFLMYAAAASGNQPITGSALALSMPKLLTGSQSFNIGRPDIKRVDEYLSLGIPGQRTFRLQGTLGPPNFHPGSGTRGGYPSVYCMLDDGTFAFDVLRYDATTEPPSLYEPDPPPPVTIEQCIPDL